MILLDLGENLLRRPLWIDLRRCHAERFLVPPQILVADFNAGNGEVVITEVAVSEPASIVLLGAGLLSLTAMRQLAEALTNGCIRRRAQPALKREAPR